LVFNFSLTVWKFDFFNSASLTDIKTSFGEIKAIVTTMTCEACNTIPPVVASGYTPKGKWEEIGGLNTYVTGSESSAKFGLVDVYDIFGPANQTLQGADLLAAALNVVVLVPDFFKGEACQGEWFSNPRYVLPLSILDDGKGGRDVMKLMGMEE
jgi:hypothetical protein